MNESIHGHQVMEMMAESQQTYSKQSLKLAIATKFGEHTRFHTCIGNDLTSDDLIEFLAAKGKFIESIEGIQMSEEQLC